ncbi:hypothetical protein [Plantactinospora sp. KLBMP9567]|uniref:hypothetical protein n=1 Tax=Plantactinospora sp. KLBMP9567 TaxID=3085900 RepID=UPI0029818A6F|nr:hypothetical protein [Plantactinospora sp. KLBMP9567]MDW5322524.1 hypothetical protein [Plantactinospora sp. KLBMP9567]
MSIERWRWAQRADQLRFHQLDAARKQAESWRTGLAGLTTLLGAVLIIKGRDTVATLAAPYRWLVVLLLGLALAGLVWATLTAIRAAAGTPSDECLLTGEDLAEWTRAEVVGVQRAIVRARRLTLAGIGLVAVAVGFTWLGPGATPAAGALVTVTTEGGTLCGALIGTDRGSLIIQVGQGDPVHRIVPLSTVTGLQPARNCPP